MSYLNNAFSQETFDVQSGSVPGIVFFLTARLLRIHFFYVAMPVIVDNFHLIYDLLVFQESVPGKCKNEAEKT